MLAVICADESGCDVEGGGFFVLPALAAGASIGHLIDFFHTTVVYKAGQAGRVTLMPLVQQERIGALARGERSFGKMTPSDDRTRVPRPPR